MGFAVWSLLLCGFCGVSSGLLAEHYCFGVCDGGFIIDGKFIGASLGTVNCTMPNLDDVG